MRKCNSCQAVLPNWVSVDGVRKNIKNRKYCLKCSPFGLHNTVKIHVPLHVRKNAQKKYQCSVCGTPSRNQKFCTTKCANDAHWTAVIEDFKAGKPCSALTAKKVLIRTNGRACSICGLKEWMTKPIPLVIDHIDGNSSNCLPSNYRIVCGNCDMQLPTYKSKNNGRGRHYRRLRYAAGMSF